ncbi:MAG: EAL domain-containing protein [Proteobacteria bacterium]|nr:EAL domain-containing protein [Pseudomonadota bacterium]
MRSAPEGDQAKSERDRFVAFAFCWADILVELDADGKITFMTGATQVLAGKEAAKLIGTQFAEFVAKRDRALVRELLKVAAKRGRIENSTIRLEGLFGESAPLSIAGYKLDELSGHFFLALRAGSSGGSRIGAPGRDQESGLFDADSFAHVAGERLKSARETGADAELTLIELLDLDALRDRLDEESEQSLITTLGAALRANSVNGDTAGQVSDGRYALVHDASVDVAELEEDLSAYTKDVDPEGQGVSVEAATVATDEDSLSDEDLANGLVYTINRFRESKGTDFNLTDFSNNLSGMIGQAVKSVKSLNDIIEKSNFDVVFHPIIGVNDGRIHHYEALARFPSGMGDASPFETITFAEDIGLIWQFDFAMAKKVVAWLSQSGNKRHSVAVNISGFSVGHPEYLEALQSLLQRNFWVQGQLLFEITESSRIVDLSTANDFIQTLRAAGYAVCLDDFGAGAASFQYLSTLEVDVVKLDGLAVKNAQRATKGRAFLTALTRLCQDLHVETIAEMIDEPKGLEFIRDCGVDYAQGFLFGEPSGDVQNFRDSIPSALFHGGS